MKSNRWVLWIYPLISCLLLAGAYFPFQNWWKITFQAERAEGEIRAMVFLREDGDASLLSGLDTRISLTRGNGSVLHLEYRDHELVAAREGSVDYAITEEGTVRLSEDISRDKDMTAQFRDVLAGKNDRANWFLLRQKREATPESFVRLEKIETAFFWEGLSRDIETYRINPEDNRVIPYAQGATHEPVVHVTRGMFSYEDENALEQRRGEMLESFERMANGERMEGADNREFILYSEPYWTIKYPVFVYTVDGVVYAGKSDIGRHGDPSLAFPLFAEVNVNFREGHPLEALMNGKITPREPGEQFLNWFSRASEIYLTRWIYPGMFLLCGVTMAGVSLIFISMLTNPPKKLPPVPAREEASL